ncbi:hypothetical protein GQ53DRAFT_886470 [Thozetella sp. PMI_491]|nr:hypothetical protein GQ53DRAFT_886470 [Thozetella sp. PMI_491]
MPSTKAKRAQRDQESRDLRAKAPVAAQFEDCCQDFLRLSDALQSNRPEATQLHGLTRDCELMLKTWGGESGASSKALDYALKCSATIMEQTHGLLVELHSTLEQGREHSHKDEGDEDESDEDDAEYDPATALDEAADIVECLFNLLPVVREPLDEFDALNPVIRDSNVHSVQLYKELAAKLFPEAPVALADRLSENTWRSRQRLVHLRQRAEDQSSLSGHRGRPGQLMMLAEGGLHFPRRLVARQQASAQQESTRANSDAGTSTVRSHLETVISRNIYPDQSSSTSITEFHVPSILEQIISRLGLPEPPVAKGKSKHWNCPYCHFELPLSIADKSMTIEGWSEHLYSDLQPYLCTFGECDHENRPFENIEKWFQHELDFHRSRMVWFCGVCRSYTESRDEFQEHLQATHGGFSAASSIHFLDSCKRYLKDAVSTQKCIFCGELLEYAEALKNHLGRHLESLALVATLDLDQQEETSLEVEDRVVDFIDEQMMLHGPTEGTSLTGEKTIPTARTDQGDDDNDGKVQTFLDKQSSRSQLQRARRILPPRCENFIGREGTLSNIHDILSTPGRICTVSGRGGVGKTTAALEYLYLFESSYSYAFWVNAENPAVCADNYKMIALALDVSEDVLPEEGSRAYFVKDCLARMDGRWLLAFDNVTDWADVAQYIPRNLSNSKSTGSVLITTREGPLLKVPSWCLQRPVELDVLSLDHGREYLLTLLQPGLVGNSLKDHEEYEEATRVVSLAECLPLAISMIAGYVKVSRCTIADFLDMWEEKESRKKNKKKKIPGPEETGIDATIHSLWEIGIREVQFNCRRLLDVLSFLDPDCIQKSLLVGDHEEEYLEFLNASETISYRRMVERLSSRRLIRVSQSDDGEPIYSIHRILQQKIQLDMEDYDFADAFRKTFRLIRKRYPQAEPTQVPIPGAWEVCKNFMPHVYSFHRIYTENPQAAELSAPKPLDLAKLFYDAGFHVWAQQTTQYDGLAFLNTAEEILDRLETNPFHKLRADIHCITGLLLLMMGSSDREQATQRLKHALNIRENIWIDQPTFDNDVMYRNAATDYSLCLLNQHKFKEAGEIMTDCYKRYKVWGSEVDNPFEYSKYYGNYSIVLMWKGQIAEAIDFIERCIQYTEKFSDGKSSQYWRRQFLLGCYLLQSGDLQGALDKHLETLDARLELVGKHHEATMLSMYAVGAIQYMQQCVECVRTARWTIEARGRLYYHLSLLYEEQGVEEAQSAALRDDAMKIMDQCRQYAGLCVRGATDLLMIFDDLQPTFQGRYTSRGLLRHLQETHIH